MLVTDAASIHERTGADRIMAAVRGGTGILQLRDPATRAGELLERALALRRLFPKTLLLVNDRVDVAQAANANGVQLPERSLPVKVARRLLGREALVGRSVHSVPEARAAAAEGADLLIVGTIYATPTHPERAPAGPLLLKAVAAAVDLPLYAIGGISVENAAECMRYGAHGVAVIRSIADAPDPEMAAGRLLAEVS
jgi:thiamine-phosphate pyrophosphorylase